MQETQVGSLGREGPLEEEIATHSSILAWAIPRTEKPGGLHSLWGQKELDTTEQLNSNNRIYRSERERGSLGGRHSMDKGTEVGSLRHLPCCVERDAGITWEGKGEEVPWSLLFAFGEMGRL